MTTIIRMEEVPPPWAAILRKQARKSPMRYKHGGFILHGDKVICVGYNQMLLRGNRKTKGRSNHVERVLCRKIPKGTLASECTVVIGRLAAEGFGDSQPCDICTSLIHKVGFKAIYHT